MRIEVRKANVKHLEFPLNRIELLKKAGKFSIREARRHQLPIFEALIQELCEDGCVTMADHFATFRAREEILKANKQVVRLISEEPRFIMQLYENFKTAEIMIRQQHIKCDGLLVAARLMYQSTFLLDQYESVFHWIVLDLYEIASKYILHIETTNHHVKEVIARFGFKYGKILSKQGNYETAIKVLSHVQTLSKGERWLPDTHPETGICKTLHEAIARLLATAYLHHAKQIKEEDASKAMKMAHRAIVVLAKVGIQSNKLLIFESYLAKIDFIMDMQRYDWALKEIMNAETHLDKEHEDNFMEMHCRLQLQKGMCYYYTSSNVDKSLAALGKAFALCVKHKLKDQEGKVLLYIGQSFAQLQHGEAKARLAYEAAKMAFAAKQDFHSLKVVNLLTAKLRSHILFPELMAKIKSHRFCDMYKLRQWKSLCRPYWDEINYADIAPGAMISVMSLYTSDDLYELIFKDDSTEGDTSEKDVTEAEIPSGDGFEQWAQKILQEETEEEAKAEKETEQSENLFESSEWEEEDEYSDAKISFISTDYEKQDDPIYCLLKENYDYKHRRH